jgi:hypothetical protein
MKKVLVLFLMILILPACVPEDHLLEIEIQNNSSEPVRDVKVFTAGDKVSFEVDVLPAGQKIDHTLRIKENSADGEYNFRFSRSNGERESATGSYLQEEERAFKKTLVFNIQERGVEVEQKALKVE